MFQKHKTKQKFKTKTIKLYKHALLSSKLQTTIQDIFVWRCLTPHKFFERANTTTAFNLRVTTVISAGD